MAGDGITRRSFLAGTGGLVLATAVGATAGATTPARSKAISPLVLSTDLYASPESSALRVRHRDRLQVLIVGPGTGGLPAAQCIGTGHGDGPEHAPRPRRPSQRARRLCRGCGLRPARRLEGTRGDAGKKTPFAVQVKPQPEAPAIGAVAPRAPSPTKAAPLGVHPICTRVPACPLHTVSLSDIIGAGKPVAVLFATPALCQSMYCGPVLDELLKVTDGYAEKITFVHVEIYTSNRGADKAPTVEAWGIPSEPWLFTVDGAGTILGRIDGAFGGDEMKFQLDALAATANRLRRAGNKKGPPANRRASP